jgi:hypothetical protein
MGAGIDRALINEEPRDPTIFGQVITRLVAAKQMGRLSVLFTPEHGRTQLVSSFLDEEGQYRDSLIRATVYDAEYLTEADIADMKKKYPEREHRMRLLGEPLLESGAVYPYDETSLKIPSYDLLPHYKYINHIDFGFNHPCAVLKMAYNPDTREYICYDLFYKTNAELPTVASWLRSKDPDQIIPTSYGHDGDQETQGNAGDAMANQLRTQGINMTPVAVYNAACGSKPNQRSVEAGLHYNRMLIDEQRLKVINIPTLEPFFKEFRVYQYKENGGVKKENDDVMDALRGCVQMIELYGKQKNSKNTWEPAESSHF